MAVFRTGEVVALAALSFGFGYFASNDTKPSGDSVADQSSETVQAYESAADYGLSGEADDSLRILATLRPSDFEGGGLRWKLSNGRWLQDHVVTLSSGLLATGEFDDRKVDQMSVAEDVIPQDTQEAMQQEGYELTPLRAVACDVAGMTYLNPWDYSVNVRSDVAVRVDPDRPGAVIKIPLGVPQQPESKTIGTSAYSRLPKLDFREVTCDELPQIERQSQDPRAFLLY